MAAMIAAALIAGAASAGAAAMVGAAVGAAFMTGAISTLIMGVVGKATAKKPSGPPPITAQGRMITIRQPASSRQVIFGEIRTGGDLTFFEASSDNQYVHMVITLAGHACAEIGDIYFNDEVVPLDDDGEATGRYAGYARIQKSLGDEGAVQPFADLVAESDGKWTSAHLQQGCAKIYVRLKANQDLYATGIPNITVVVRGENTITDSRTSTAGYTTNAALVIAHYLSNSVYGLSATFASEIDDTTLDAQAAVCDERVTVASNTARFVADATTDRLTLATGSRVPLRGDGVRVSSTNTLPAPLTAATTYYATVSAGGTIQLATTFANAMAGTAIDITDAGAGVHTLTYYDEPRFRINGAFRVNETPRNVLQRMLGCMAGSAIKVGGQWYIYAGAYDAPTITLDEDDSAGGLRVQSLASRRESCNGVKGLFTDPSNSWQPTDFPPIASDTYKADDGGERVWKDVDYSGFVTSHAQSQRLAKIDLLRTRQALTVSGRFKLSAYRAMTGRTVALTNTKFGWSGKAFEVVMSRFIVDGDGALGVELTLRETAAAVYDWSSSEEQTVDLAPNTNLPDPATVGTPSVPSVSEELYSTSGSAGVKSKALVSWSAPDDALVDSYQLEFKLSTDSTWSIRPLTRSTNDEILDLEPLLTYNFRVKAINVFSVGGSYSPTATKGMQGLLQTPADVSGFAVQSLAGMAKFVLDLSTDLDVRIGGRWFVRHTPLTTGGTWDNAVLVNPNGYPGDTTIGVGPLMSGTYLAKFRDSTGHYSETAASFVVTEALLTALTGVATASFHPNFAGTKTNTVVASSALQLDTDTLWDSLTGNIDDMGYIDYLGGISATGSCLFTSKLDMLTVQAVRLYATIKSEAFDVADLWDSKTGLIDSWGGLIDGDVIGDAEVTLMVRVTSDDPASGGASWGPWHPLGMVADYSCRGFQFRADFTTGTSTHNRKITELTVTAKS